MWTYSVLALVAGQGWVSMYSGQDTQEAERVTLWCAGQYRDYQAAAYRVA